jgi:hypothetical protein
MFTASASIPTRFRLDDEHDAYVQWATPVGRDNLKAFPATRYAKELLSV